MIYFENQAATLSLFPDKKLAFTEWKGFASGIELKEILDKSLELITGYEVLYWLNDNRNMKVIRSTDQEYINSKWLPEFIKLSKIKKSATIESDDIFNKMSIENILRVSDKIIPFDIKFFPSQKAAIDWLGLQISDIDLGENLKSS